MGKNAKPEDVKQKLTKKLVDCLNDIQKEIQHSRFVVDGLKQKLYIDAIDQLGKFIQEFQDKDIDKLTQDQADIIINGYFQLRRLLPQKSEDVLRSAAYIKLYNKICLFNAEYREIPKEYELFLMSVTSFDELDTGTLEKKPYLIKDDQGKYQIWGYKKNKWQLTDIGILKVDFEWKPSQTVFIAPKNQIFNTLQEGHTPLCLLSKITERFNVVDQGSPRQKKLIARLREECIAYRTHLNKKLKRAPDESRTFTSTESEEPPRLNQKFNQTQSLIAILDDTTIDATKKIKDFKVTFNESKDNLKEHRDNRLTLFFKNIAFLLSSFLLGAGMIYSKATKGSCNFFESHGKVVTDNLQAELDKRYNESIIPRLRY